MVHKGKYCSIRWKPTQDDLVKLVWGYTQLQQLERRCHSAHAQWISPNCRFSWQSDALLVSFIWPNGFIEKANSELTVCESSGTCWHYNASWSAEIYLQLCTIETVNSHHQEQPLNWIRLDCFVQLSLCPLTRDPYLIWSLPDLDLSSFTFTLLSNFF
jgi:hypothetical protein